MIAAIENAILARFKAAADAGVLGYKFRTLETYPADWDAYFRAKVPNAPGAWAVFAGFGETTAVSGNGVMGTAKFGVVVMAENARNETAQRQGGPVPAEPGSYQLALDAIGMLVGQDLGLPIGSIEIHGLHFVRTQEIVRDRPVSLMALEISTTLVIRANAPAIAADPAALADFSTFHVDWDVPPFGGVGPDLPDDAHADAVDHVTLETTA